MYVVTASGHGKGRDDDAGPAGQLVAKYRAELTAIEDLLANDLALPAVDGLERLIELLEETLGGGVPDRAGEIGRMLTEAQSMHAKASLQANQDQAELGVHLANWALSSDWDVFLESPTTHADSLSEDGLDSFESVVDGYFRQLPALAVGEQDEYGAKPSRFVVAHLKRQLAARRGTDAVVEVMSRDLSAADRYAEIAQVLVADGREADAQEWLDRAAGLS